MSTFLPLICYHSHSLALCRPFVKLKPLMKTCCCWVTALTWLLQALSWSVQALAMLVMEVSNCQQSVVYSSGDMIPTGIFWKHGFNEHSWFSIKIAFIDLELITEIICALSVYFSCIFVSLSVYRLSETYLEYTCHNYFSVAIRVGKWSMGYQTSSFRCFTL